MEFNAYLFFDGQCAEAFKFYEKCLGGKVESTTYAGTPGEADVPADWRDKIIHARLSVGNHTLMGSDPPPAHYQKPQGFSVSVAVNNVSEGERIFNCISEGGSVLMPFGTTFWAAGFGMCVDRFGISWMVNCDRPNK